MSSAFLVNAVVLFSGVTAFVLAGFAGAFIRRLHPWRYRLMLAPLGFVVAGGIGISAEAHLLRWWYHGASPHTLAPGIFQMVVLILAGSAGALAGIGLGTSMDRTLPDLPTYVISKYWEREALEASEAASDKVVPISEGRRQPGVVRRIRAISHHD